MPDREKVIYALKLCTRDAVADDCICANCPYFVSIEYGCHRDQMEKDALALLKEKEALKPKKVKGYTPPMYTIYEYECEKCKAPMINKQPFCMGCGRSVKWE